MIVPNALITGYDRRDGSSAVGAAVFSARPIVGVPGIPAESSDPRWAHVTQASSLGVRVQRVVTVERAALAAQSIDPRPGDRVLIAAAGRTETWLISALMLDEAALDVSGSMDHAVLMLTAQPSASGSGGAP